MTFLKKLPDFVFWGLSMTARRVNGELRFLMTGARPNQNSPVYEMSYPGYGPGVRAAPRSTLIKNWGDVYQGKRLIKSTGGIDTRGLHWANNQLYWSYGDEYNAAGSHDPSIGTSVLNADGSVQAYGPWRTQEHSQKTRGYMLTVPTWFTQYTSGHTFGVGAPITSGNASSPWGAMLVAGQLPSNSTPADVPGTSHASIACQRLIYHDIDNKQRRDANYKVCDWNVKYDATKGATLRPGVPEFQPLDTMSAAAWVDLPTKHGVVFFGQLVTTIPGYAYGGGDTMTHVWYGPPVCVHGQNGWGVSVSVGPATGTSVPYLWVYDPADLALAAQRRVNPWSFDPTSVIPVNTISPIPAKANALYMFGGAYFDADTSSLFVSQVGVDPTNPYESQPVVHVFKIRG